MSATTLFKRSLKAVSLLFVCLFFMLFAAPTLAERLPELIGKVKPADIAPGADRFGEPSGKPMTAKIYAGDKELGVVYITTDVVNTRGYSAKPIDTMVALGNDGTILGAKLLAHSEPIVLIGIPQSKVDAFISKYVGTNPVKNPPKDGETPADIVTGATVTVLVIGDGINRSARAVYSALNKNQGGAAAANSSAKTRPHRLMNMQKQDILSWQQLIDSKAVANLHLTVADVNKRFEAADNKDAAAHPEKGPDDDLFVNLYTAVVSQPAIGKSLLGDAGWNSLQTRLKPGQQAILVAGEGRYSFKGSGYVRGGIFDRIELIQGSNTHRFTDVQHDRLLSLAAQGAPHFKEISLFITPEDIAFDPAEPWRLQLMIQREISVQNKAFIGADLHYSMPTEFTVDDPKGEPVVIEEAAPVQAASAAAESEGAAAGDGAKQLLWKQIWQTKMWHVVAMMLMLAVLIVVFFFQDTLVKYPEFYTRFRIAYLTVTLFYIGWYLQAQLSVVNVLTFTSALIHEFSWDFFLMDPFVFTLWCATAMAMLFWGRGAFCGWLCPFGSLQELTNRIAKKLGVKQLDVPFGLHTRLTAIKYVIFMILFGVSLYDLGMAEKLAEIEPFKTAIILKFVREWWFVVFAVSLLVAGLFVERFFCRYLCPLGAAMAVPAKLQIFTWLRRYQMCGNPCQVCKQECPVQAIHPEGFINLNECIQCLHCQVLYNHTTKCPQVVATNKKKAKQAAAKAELEAQKAADSQAQEQVVHFVRNADKPSDSPPAADS